MDGMPVAFECTQHEILCQLEHVVHTHELAIAAERFYRCRDRQGQEDEHHVQHAIPLLRAVYPVREM